NAGNHWLGIELVGKQNRDIAGARLTLEVNGQKLTRFMFGGGSYLAANDPRRVFGLGKAAQVDRLTVQWPWSGQTQSWENLPIDQYHRLVEGQKEPQRSEAKRR